MDTPKTPIQNSRDLDDDDSVVDADIILQHKENIQPLASGRRAAALASSLVATPKQRDGHLAAARAQLEEDAELAMDNDDDPLAAWLRYVEWTVENYPQGASVESGLLELLERATRLFAQDPRYKNDMRYLKLWIQYASHVDHPNKIFAYLNANEIGTAYALFYEEYCNSLERGGRRDEALEMYDIGIARKAHPLARLQARKRDFSARMMNSSLQPVTPSHPSSLQLSSSQSGRQALGDRSQPRRRENAENRDPLASQQSLPRSGNNRGAFQIYTEGGDNGAGNEWRDLESRDTHRKENHRSAVSAQGEVLKQQILDAPRTPRVAVYVDEDDSAKTPHRPREESVGTLSAKKPTADTLKRDPLRNFHQAESPSSNSKSKTESKSSNQSSQSAKPSSKSKTSRSIPSTKPNEKLQINTSLLILADGTEIHPLELRARDFGVADKKWPLPTPEETTNQNMSEITSIDRSLSEQAFVDSRQGDHEELVDFEGTKPMTFGSTFAMTREATVTINTKAALMDVYGMYNSPTKSITTGKQTAAMRDPQELAAPTPLASAMKANQNNENAGTARKLTFQPFVDSTTPAASKISSENQKTPIFAFRTPGTSKGMSTGKRTLALKTALQTVESFPEEDDEYEPVTPAPMRQAKPLASIVPFVDAPAKQSPSVKAARFEPFRDSGPKEEEDIFAIDSRASTSHDAHEDEDIPPETDYGETEEEWDEDDNTGANRGEGDWETNPDNENVDGNEEEDFQDQEEYQDGRWHPALTPITERTYEHTGNSRMWTTPLALRDRSVADVTINEERAYRDAEILAEELRDGQVEDEAEGDEVEEEERGTAEELEDGTEPLGIICDPYSRPHINQTIAKLTPPSINRDLRPKVCGQLPKLQKFGNPTPKGKKAATTPRSNSQSRSSRESDDSYSLTLDGDNYNVIRKLGEGGFGAVFLAEDVALQARNDSFDEDVSAGASSSLVAVKVVKPPAVWESYALERIHQTIPDNIRRSIIRPRNQYVYSDESHLILDYSTHGTLLEAVNKAGELRVGQSLGSVPSSIPGMNEMLVVFFTIELLRTLEGLHSFGFIHGDLKIDNCMVRLEDPLSSLSTTYDPSGGSGWWSKGVLLIDFGRAIDTNLYPRGTKYVTDWKMDKRDCLEMREGRPWTYETDYYGLAGIVFCMLYGKYMELPVVKDGIQKLPAALKRYWKLSPVWERLFSALLNPNGFGKPLPIIDELRTIRQEMETWLVENGSSPKREITVKTLLMRLEVLSV